MSHDPGPEPLHPSPPRQSRPVRLVGILTAVLAAVCGLALVAFFVVFAVALGFFGGSKG